MPKSIKKKTFHLTFAVDMTVMRSEKSVCLANFWLQDI